MSWKEGRASTGSRPLVSPFRPLLETEGRPFGGINAAVKLVEADVGQCWTLVLAASTSNNHANSWMKMLKGQPIQLSSCLQL